MTGVFRCGFFSKSMYLNLRGTLFRSTPFSEIPSPNPFVGPCSGPTPPNQEAEPPGPAVLDTGAPFTDKFPMMRKENEPCPRELLPHDPLAHCAAFISQAVSKYICSPLGPMKVMFFSAGEKHGSADRQVGYRAYGGVSKPPPYIGWTIFNVVPFSKYYLCTSSIGKLSECVCNCVQNGGVKGESFPLVGVWG